MSKKKIKTYFRFKDGYCHIQPDTILFTTTPEPDVNHLIQKKNIPYKQIIIYAFFSILFSLYFFDQYQFGSKFLAFIFLIFASLFSIGSVNLFTMKLHPMIKRSHIQSVKYVKKIPLIAPACIQIQWKTKNQRKQNTWLYLNDDQIAEAIEVLKLHQLLS